MIRSRVLLVLPLMGFLAAFAMTSTFRLMSSFTASTYSRFCSQFLLNELARRREIQEVRLQNVHKKCLELNDSWNEPTWQAISVSRQKRVVMCLVGKAAGTTWMRVLLRLTGKQDAAALADTNRHILHSRAGAFLGRFNQMNGSKRDHYLMGHYHKVMFVREPLERLISGYRDKMFRAIDYVGMRKAIKHKFRPKISNSSKEFAKNVTFTEFIRYVLWEREHKAQVDVHWRPQYDVCRPCHIKYDYLGYYETMRDDAKDVLREIAVGSDVHFPLGDFDSRMPNSREYLELFENVSVSDIRRILDFYRNDYKVFGYEIPDVVRRRLQDENFRNSSYAHVEA